MTLIELVIVIALVGLMASVVTPNLISPDRTRRAQTTAERIATLVDLGRTAAIERARRVELTIDPATGTFWLDFPDTAGTIALAEGASLISRAKRVHLHFEPDGRASMDELLFVRQGETTLALAVER